MEREREEREERERERKDGMGWKRKFGTDGRAGAGWLADDFDFDFDFL